MLALAIATRAASRETRQDRIESVVAGLTDCIEDPGREARKLQDADWPCEAQQWLANGRCGGRWLRAG